LIESFGFDEVLKRSTSSPELLVSTLFFYESLLHKYKKSKNSEKTRSLGDEVVKDDSLRSTSFQDMLAVRRIGTY